MNVRVAIVFLVINAIGHDFCINAASTRQKWNHTLRENAAGGVERIHGGEDAARGQFPFMAAVVLDQVALCGGSLISSTTVLTAARCVMGFDDVVVYLGAHNLTDETESGRVVVRASKLIAHEDFNLDNSDHDLGLIKLPLSVEASNIAPVALPSRSFAEGNTFENYTATILGWGISRGTTEFSDILQMADSIVISNEECDRLYQPPYISQFVTGAVIRRIK